MKLSFKSQIILCVVLVIVGNILNTVSGQWIFRSIAYVVDGLIFIFHPVLPKHLEPTKENLRWMKVAGIVFILVGLLTRA